MAAIVTPRKKNTELKSVVKEYVLAIKKSKLRIKKDCTVECTPLKTIQKKKTTISTIEKVTFAIATLNSRKVYFYKQTISDGNTTYGTAVSFNASKSMLEDIGDIVSAFNKLTKLIDFWTISEVTEYIINCIYGDNVVTQALRSLS